MVKWRITTVSIMYIPFVTKSSVFLQEPARPLLSDDQMPLYVLSIQERAEQLASQFEGKPERPQVKFSLLTQKANYHTF